MIVLLIALTNYVPEVSVRHEERTLFINTWYKSRVGRALNVKDNLSDNLKKSFIK